MIRMRMCTNNPIVCAASPMNHFDVQEEKFNVVRRFAVKIVARDRLRAAHFSSAFHSNNMMKSTTGIEKSPLSSRSWRRYRSTAIDKGSGSNVAGVSARR
ncbi:hypothetical protein [Aliidongia dinghuensis]|uniref:hypothetical protein n=1 Tax=Aliidongia dinghuensis TaxID=1867774 RepID=UPI001E547BE9|nr:hypothetical protein [Aliidongia dinghuensis]